MSQKVKDLAVKDLVLWTENPRDPVDPNATDQEITDKALDDKLSKWTLRKLAAEMGDYYDFSELPTVVYHNSKPVVYDGNRRMILAKLKHGLVKIGGSEKIDLPEIPASIPCNVCSIEIALNNVFRKHADSGSWAPLERDIFVNKFRGEEKSVFLVIEENTGLISSNPHLNQGFVKKEIFREDHLKSLGFEIKDDKLLSSHSDRDAKKILDDISQKIESKAISTRENRGLVKEVLEPATQELIDRNKKKPMRRTNVSFRRPPTKSPTTRVTKRTQRKNIEIFGGPLYLKIGEVSNLYRDISDLYKYYLNHKASLSPSFASLIRMSMRLLAETAAKEKGKKFGLFLEDHFDAAKATLGQDEKTTLRTQNVNKGSMEALLHIGAHNYQAANNIDQTIALSLVIGAVLTISHGKVSK